MTMLFPVLSAVLPGSGGGEAGGEQKLVAERLRKEGAEWRQRAKEAELAVKKYGESLDLIGQNRSLHF